LKPINGNGKKSKKKSNNYASVDCGAEVISVNPESTRCAAILDENKDDYMLNPCSANIWSVGQRDSQSNVPLWTKNLILCF
jgi:hypothetical protein